MHSEYYSQPPRRALKYRPVRSPWRLYDFALGTNHLKLLFRRSLSDIIDLSVEQKQCDTYLDPENNKMLFSVKCESFN